MIAEDMFISAGSARKGVRYMLPSVGTPALCKGRSKHLSGDGTPFLRFYVAKRKYLIHESVSIALIRVL